MTTPAREQLIEIFESTWAATRTHHAAVETAHLEEMAREPKP